MSLGTQPNSPQKPVRAGNEGMAPIPADARPLKGHINVEGALVSASGRSPNEAPPKTGTMGAGPKNNKGSVEDNNG